MIINPTGLQFGLQFTLDRTRSAALLWTELTCVADSRELPRTREGQAFNPQLRAALAQPAEPEAVQHSNTATPSTAGGCFGLLSVTDLLQRPP
jgi:hypothetical protein